MIRQSERTPSERSLEVQEANEKLVSVPTSSTTPAAPVPASPSAVPPTSLCTMISLPKAKTPSFPTPGSITGGHALPQLPPPMPSGSSGQATN